MSPLTKVTASRGFTAVPTLPRPPPPWLEHSTLPVPQTWSKVHSSLCSQMTTVWGPLYSTSLVPLLYSFRPLILFCRLLPGGPRSSAKLDNRASLLFAPVRTALLLVIGVVRVRTWVTKAQPAAGHTSKLNRYVLVKAKKEGLSSMATLERGTKKSHDPTKFIFGVFT